MPIPSTPNILENVLGYNADVNSIPSVTEDGSGSFSYQSGFPAITQVPLSSGGIAPARRDFNAVIQLISQHLFWLQSGGLYTWNASLNYVPGNHVLGSDGVEYICQAVNGPDYTGVGYKDPTTDDGTYWKSAPAVYGGGSDGGVLLGTIVAFSGSFGGTDNRYPIPLGSSEPDTNWCLCDGTQTNGYNVPDLRDRFIVGAGSTYSSGATGGSATHTHSVSGTVGETTLSTSQMPEHTHSYGPNTQSGYGGGSPYNGIAWGGTANTTRLTTSSEGESSSHTHSLSSVSSDSSSSLPPYYALAYIMRCA